MTLQIESGEYYIRRDGEIAGPAIDTHDDVELHWEVGGIFLKGDGTWHDKPKKSDVVEHLPRTDPRHPEHSGDCTDEIEFPDTPDPRLTAGNWWVDYQGNRFVYVNGFDGWLIRQYVDCVSSESIEQNSGDNPAVLHLPDCDGFDWEPEPVTETVELIEYVCRSEGRYWTHNIGGSAIGPMPGDAYGVVVSSRYERGVRVVEVERLP